MSTTSGGTLDGSVYYSIHGNFADSNNLSETVFTKVNATTYQTSVTFPTKGGDFGIRVATDEACDNQLQDGGCYQVKSGYTAAYNVANGAQTFNLEADGGSNLSIKDYSSISGTLTFTLKVDAATKMPTSLKIEMITPSYTVYFYDTAETPSEVRVYEWASTQEITQESFPGDYMVATGQYVYVDNEYYPVWKYSLTSDLAPQNLRITYYVGDAQKSTDKLAFQDGGVYTNNGACNTKLSLVDQPEAGQVYLYMHFKEDYLKEGDQSRKPKCHLSGPDDFELHGFNSADEDMTLVNEKYQIWRYAVNETDAQKCNGIDFYFTDKSGSYREYKASDVPTGESFDSANWSTYIYATASYLENNVSKPYACQTYLTYEKFLELEGKEHTTAYVVGSENLEVNDVKLGKWDIGNPLPITADDGCFYLKITPAFGSEVVNSDTYAGKQWMGFKVSWIKPEISSDGHDSNCDYGQRLWATYDLGIIGVDDTDSRVTDVTSLVSDGQLAIFNTDKSIPYLYYNQYVWTLVKSDDATTNSSKSSDGLAKEGQTYYAVIDTHPECHSVTLCSFDPDPSVTINPSTIYRIVNPLDAADADMMLQDEDFYGNLGITDERQKAHFVNVNRAKGYVNITDTDIENLRRAGFGREYLVTVNGTTALNINSEYDGLVYRLNAIPVGAGVAEGANNNVAIRARLTDQSSGVSFHSRTGSGTFTDNEMDAEAPEIETKLTARYVYSGKTDDDNKYIYDLYVSGLQMTIPQPDSQSDPKFNVHADYKFFKDDPNTPFESSLILADDANYNTLTTTYGITDVPSVSLTDGQNWSDYLKEGNVFPVLVHDVAHVSDPSLLDQSTITCRVYAVYPFIYDENADPYMLSDESAPRRAEEVLDFTGYSMTTERRFTDITVQPDLDLTLSGIEAVNVDAQDLYAPVEYYTISGVRVSNNPAPGIYIRRQGNTVTKLAIR
jgi:hypothetical protein